MTDSKGPGKPVARFLELHDRLDRYEQLKVGRLKPETLAEKAWVFGIKQEMDAIAAAFTPEEAGELLLALDPSGVFTRKPTPPAIEPEEVAPLAAKSGKPKRVEKTKREWLEELVSEIERRAANVSEKFNREDAPGDLEDLFWIACKWNPEVFDNGSKPESLRNHTDGIIKWRRSASNNDPAKPLYLKLFPEFQANVGQMGHLRSK